MLSRRIVLLALLLLLPVLVCVAFGAHAIWVTGYWKVLWVVLPVCWLLAWAIAKWWPPPQVTDPARTLATEIPGHWSPRDEQAAQIVQRRQELFTKIDPAQLVDPHHYVNEIQELATELSVHYERSQSSQQNDHPADHAKAVEALTLVEIAAAARLAIDDIERFLVDSVPGSRLLTLKQWQTVTKIPQWYSLVSKVYWATSLVINPANILRYGSSKVMLDPVKTQIQSEVIATIYMRFIRQVGFYLIEMNSGRLRGGAEAYIETFNQQNIDARSPGEKTGISGQSSPTTIIKIALIGQTGSGKSSLVNALMAAQTDKTDDPSTAVVDALPSTRQTQTYHWTGGESSPAVVLVDTPGYGEAGASDRQIAQYEETLLAADIVLLVVAAHWPAKRPDQLTLGKLRDHYQANPKLKPPKILVVMTHVDLIPPATIWEPPYQYDSPTEAKEQNIADAVRYTKEVFSDQIEQVVPVCLATDPSRCWGVEQNLLPALIGTLDEARAISFLKAFEQRIDLHRLSQLISQAGKLASSGVRTWLDEWLSR